MNMSIEKIQSAFYAEVIQKVRQAQYDALKIVNVYLINLYWDLGKAITEKQALGWGKAIVPTLSAELKKEFPGITGFSVTNLWYMD